MKLRKGLLLLLLLPLTACSSVDRLGRLFEPTATVAVPSATPSLALSLQDSPAAATEAGATVEHLPSPVPSVTPNPPTVTATPAPLQPDLALSAADVFLYPVPKIYAGDRVTFQVWPFVPESVEPRQVDVLILVDGKEIVTGTLGGRSHLSGEAVGLFEWAWDTTEMAGTHQVEIYLDWQDAIWAGDENPENNRVVLDVTVGYPDAESAASARAIWKMAESDCCRIHVVSGTAADRDLPFLLEAVDAAVQQAVTKLGEPAQQQFDVYLVDRVIGQGGYAGSGMVVSYLDRDYASNNLHQVLVHEAVHLLDRQFAPQRIAFLTEGLAVWASDGHYKPEDINLAAAALVDIGRHLPLVELVEEFYPVQHEIGYLQAASVVAYLIDRFGWSRFRTFYTEVSPQEGETLVEAVDVQLQKHYGMSLEKFEAEWLAYLASLPWSREDVLNVQTTIRYYDTMRHYQLHHDPTAHFLKAWLPSPSSVQEHGSPADLSGHPEAQLNITLEVMLQAAGEAMHQGNYNRANALLGSVERAITNQGQFIDPFAQNYWKIVTLIAEMGYEVQQLDLIGDKALAVVSPVNSSLLEEMNLTLEEREWILSN